MWSYVVVVQSQYPEIEVKVIAGYESEVLGRIAWIQLCVFDLSYLHKLLRS